LHGKSGKTRVDSWRVEEEEERRGDRREANGVRERREQGEAGGATRGWGEAKAWMG